MKSTRATVGEIDSDVALSSNLTGLTTLEVLGQSRMYRVSSTAVFFGRVGIDGRVELSFRPPGPHYLLKG